jgi:hypothetical protein
MHLLVAAIISAAVLLCITGCKPGHIVEGKYSTKSDYAVTSMIFRSDSTFSIYRGSCLRLDSGCGTYLLTQDSLILNYDTCKAPRTICTIDTLDSYGTLMSISVKCLGDSGPISDAFVFCRGTHGAPFITDSSGVASFKLSSESFPVVLKCVQVGYDVGTVVINQPGNYRVNVKMTYTTCYSIEGGTVERYEVKSLMNRRLCLVYSYDISGKDYHSQMILNRVR